MLSGEGIDDRPGEERPVVVEFLIAVQDADGRFLVRGDLRAADEGPAIADRVVDFSVSLWS